MFYYKKKEPNVGDIVYVTIKNVSTAGTYCNLLEYNNMEGLILSTELDRKMRDDKRQIRIHDPKKFDLATTYCAMVLAVNKKTKVDENGIESQEISGVDVSYKRVEIEKRESMLEQFGYLSSIKKLCDEFVFVTKLSSDVVYPLSIWKFTEMPNFDAKSKYYDFLKHPETFCEFLNESHLEESNVFVENMKSRITYTTMTVEQLFDFKMFDTDAINKIKQVLEYTNPTTRVECVSSPKYKITVSGYSMEECDQKIKECFDELNAKSKQFRSAMSLKPKSEDNGIIKKQELHIKPVKMLTV